MSNHEGKYLGNPVFTPFFSAMEEIKGRLSCFRTYLLDNIVPAAIVFVHPSDPHLELDGAFVEANPTVYTAVSDI